MSRIKKAIKKVSKAEGFQKLGVEEVENKLNTFDYSQLPKPGKNKGDRGQLFETALGIPNGSDLIDLIDGELKSFTEGETIKVTALTHCLDEILKSKTINEQNDFDHYQQLADDFGYIAANVKKAIVNKETLHTITGPNGLLQIRTNASKNKKTGKYTPLCYNGVELRDKYMAFYLLADFGKSITK